MFLPYIIPTFLLRGRDSNQERIDLARKSLTSEKIDAKITAFFFFPKDDKLLAKRIPMSDYSKFKYIISIDGTVAAY